MPLQISKDKLWTKLGYAPNQAQRTLHADPARFQVVAAGRRTGKSTYGGRELMPCAYRAYLMRNELTELSKRHEYWVVGPEYSDAEKEFRTFYNDCKRLKMPFDKPGTYYNARGGDMTVSLWEGRFILTAQSAKYPDHLAGEGLSGVILAEAAKMRRLVFDKYLRPALADFRGWGKFTSTPEGRNWFFDIWDEALHGDDPEWSAHRFPSWANEVIFPLGRNDPEILSLIKDMSDEMAKQEVGADFSQFVGQVFKDWDEQWHVRRCTYQPNWPLFLATDYGWQAPNVALFIQVDPFDRVQIISEYYQNHRSPEEMAEDLLTGAQDPRHPALSRAATLLFPDPASPAASHTLAERLQLRVMANTGGDLATRLELGRKWLKDENTHLDIDHPDRRPKTFVDPSCKNFRREMASYRYAETKEESLRTPSEKPMDKDDHCPEAWGRFLMGHFGAQAVQAPARTHRVRYARRRRASRRTLT